MESQDLPVMSKVKIEEAIAGDMPLHWRTRDTASTSKTTGDSNTPESTKPEAVADTDAWKKIKIKCEPLDDSETVNQESEPVTHARQETDSDTNETCSNIVVKFEPVSCEEEEEGLPPQPAPRQKWRKPSTSTSTAHGGDQADADQTTVLQTWVNNITGTPSSLDSAYVSQEWFRLPMTSAHREQAPSVPSVPSGPDTSHGCRDEGTRINHPDTVTEFTCDVCSKNLTLTGSCGPGRHRGTQTGYRCFVCDVCCKVFPMADCGGDDKSIPTGLKPKFVCDLCSKAFLSSGPLTRHMKTHTDHKPFVCDVCSKAHTCSGNLRKHMLRTHSGHKPYVCDVCSKAFKESSDLKAHVRTHTGEKPFICDVCGRAFTQSCHLKEHMKIHTDHKSFVCDVCSKDFISSGYLRKHMKIHSDHKPFVCEVCSKAFTGSAILKRHVLKTHVGDKPYICSICSKAFAYSVQLRDHMCSHTGHKPFKCEVCSKAFVRSKYLTIHMRIHTGDKPFVCHVCSRAFTQSGNLKTHMKTHAGYTGPSGGGSN